MDSLHAIAELTIALAKAQGRGVVRDVLRQAADILGCDYYLFAMQSGRGIDPPAQPMVTNYSKRWRNYYDETGALSYDPVILKAFQFQGPFRWDGLHVTEQQLRLREQDVLAGMLFGVSCPDLGPDGGIGVVSFCGRNPIATGTGEWDRAAAAISLLTSSIQKAVTRMLLAERTKGPAAQLTASERRCLALMASGKTVEAAAVELKIRPRTARYYLDRAAEKLTVATPKEAVLKAVALGLMDVRNLPPDPGFSGSDRFA